MLTAPAVLEGLETGRRELLRDLGTVVPQVPLSYFKSSLLPPLRHGINVDDIVARLKTAGHITDENRWALFATNPSEAWPVENLVFRDFAAIAQHVCEQAILALEQAPQALQGVGERHQPLAVDTRPTAIFECNPDLTSQSELIKPDSFAVLNPDTPAGLPAPLDNSVSWDVIAVPGEFKKKSAWYDINNVSLEIQVAS